MGKTFVFNAGEAKPPSLGMLTLTQGVFFDGTSNNRRNTEIVKKVKGIDEYHDQTATDEEKEIYQQYAMERNLGSLWLKKTDKTDSSYFNDFTNVARKYMCCDTKKYALYIEGIGTTTKGSDSSSGAGWGRGGTGIIAKVKAGCELLAATIKSGKGDNDTIKFLEIVVDVFGFSRGAAAARNFVYNLQKKAYAPIESWIPGPVYHAKNKIFVDHGGFLIKDHWVKNGLLPPMGHLGTALLDIGIERELVDGMKITLRFLGIYDTVASYDPVNLLPNFKKYINQLHLHELGNPRKAVHFTAMDEHRENFSLTPLKIGIEKEFPGVHSDVGGSYNNGLEVVDGLDTQVVSGLRLLDYKEHLKAEYWYKEEQLKITGGSLQWALKGTRQLKNTYSYIPLHFMVSYFLDTLFTNEENPFVREVEADYSVIEDEILVAAKRRLKPYIFNEKGGEKWTFLPDELWEVQQRENELKQNKKAIQDNFEQVANLASEQSIGAQEEQVDLDVILLDELIIKQFDAQYILRVLRNQYLHWSANKKSIGMAPYTDRRPEENRKRRKF